MASELQSFSAILGRNKNVAKEEIVTATAPPPIAVVSLVSGADT